MAEVAVVVAVVGTEAGIVSEAAVVEAAGTDSAVVEAVGIVVE